MQVLIMTDMEGVSGIVAWEQVGGGAAMFEEGRRPGLDLQLADSRPARPRLRVGRPPRLGPLYRNVGGGLRRLLAGGHARAQ